MRLFQHAVQILYPERKVQFYILNFLFLFTRGRQNSITDKHELTQPDDTEPMLQRAIEESLTLYELQERDPSAFPALPVSLRIPFFFLVN